MDSAEPAGEPEWTMTMESQLVDWRSDLVLKMASTPRSALMLARGESDTPEAVRDLWPVSRIERSPIRPVMDAARAPHTILVRTLGFVRTVTLAGMRVSQFLEEGDELRR